MGSDGGGIISFRVRKDRGTVFSAMKNMGSLNGVNLFNNNDIVIFSRMGFHGLN